MGKRIFLFLWSFIIMSTAIAAEAEANGDTLHMRTSRGNVVIELKPDLAPKHVERITNLTKEGFYNEIIFHRVIEGFMAQTGDPTGTGRGGSSLPDLPAEFSDYQYRRGTVGMARTNDPNSANSQFFICFTDNGCEFLTGQYTVWGQVIEGMDNVDQLARGEPPVNPDKIIKMEVKSAGGEETPEEDAEDASAEESSEEGSDEE